MPKTNYPRPRGPRYLLVCQHCHKIILRPRGTITHPLHTASEMRYGCCRLCGYERQENRQQLELWAREAERKRVNAA